MTKLTPSTVLVLNGREAKMLPVIATVAYPPRMHPAECPIISEYTAVELRTQAGSRWFGFTRAWIGSDLRMHVQGFSPLNEIVNAWEDADD